MEITNWSDFLWGVHAGFWLGVLVLQTCLWFMRRDKK